MIIRSSILGLIITAAVGFFVWGQSDNGISQSEADRLQKQSVELQQKAQKTAEDIREGRVDAQEAAEDLQDDAVELTDDALEAAQDSNIPDDGAGAARGRPGAARRARHRRRLIPEPHLTF